MKTGLKRWLALLLTVALFPLVAVAETASAPEATTARYYMPDYFAQTSLDLTQYKGKAVYLNFFTGWCQYCMEEMPDIKRFYDAYSSDDVALILVHAWSGENADDSAAVVEQFGLQGIPMIEDEDLTLTSMFVQGFPTSMFIDPEGYMTIEQYQGGMITYDIMTEQLAAMGIQPKAESAVSTAVATPAPTVADATSSATRRVKR